MQIQQPFTALCGPWLQHCKECSGVGQPAAVSLLYKQAKVPISFCTIFHNPQFLPLETLTDGGD